jgi:uncharacterized membrane protein
MLMLILLFGVAFIVIALWRRTTTQAEVIRELTARIGALEVRAKSRSETDRMPATALPRTHAPAPEPSPAVVTPPPPPIAAAPPTPRPAPPPVEISPTPVRAHTAASTPSESHPAEAIASTATHDSLETRIGARWLLYVGVIAIVVGIAYFEKLAIDNHWINETARTIQGALIGIAVVYAGMRFVRSGYRVYGQLLSGGGIAIEYVSAYAAFNLYHLIGRPTAFVLMATITAAAALLADRQRSQGLALIAVGGGFATPFLLPGNTDAEITLFTYDAILIAGTMFLAHRRVWPSLNLVGYGFTVLTVLGWAARFYTAAKYLPTEFFLSLFCAMYVYLVREMRRSPDVQARLAHAILLTAPVLYYVASLAILTPHAAALLVYLVALAVVGAVAGVRSGATIRLIVFVAVFAPLASWIDAHAGRTWLVGGLAAVGGIYVINVLADVERLLRDEMPIDAASIALVHMNALAAYGCAYLLIDAVRDAATAPFTAAVAAWHAVVGLWLARRRRDMSTHFAALAGVFLATAIGLEFEGPAMIAGWATEAAAVVWLGLRDRREWFRIGGVALFAFAVGRLLLEQMLPPLVGHIVLFNTKTAIGLYVVGLTYLLAWLHHRASDVRAQRAQVGAALTLAKLLILSTAAAEITDYWVLHPHDVFEPSAQLIIAMFIVGASIVWLGLVRQQEWIRGIGALVVSIAAIGTLSLQFVPAPSGYHVVLNGRVAAGVIAIATLYGLARLHTRFGAHLSALAPQIAILLIGASLFTLSLLTSEIDAYWSARGAAEVWSIAREGLQSIVWAAVGSVIIWMGVNGRQAWIRIVGALVLVIGVTRLVALQFAAAPPDYVVLANVRLMASLIVVAVLFGLERLYHTQDEPLDPALRPRTVLLFAANALVLSFLTSEITAYWHVRDVTNLAFRSTTSDSHFARELMLSVTWAVYATVLIVAGIRKQYAPIRYFAIALFAVTIVKVFGFDMAELDRIYRVSSIIVLGVMLLATSYLYNRFRARLS